MEFTETAALCAWLAAIVPHQQLDDETPRAWQPLLADVAVTDARTAVLAILKRARYVAPLDILSEVKAVRRDRLQRAGYDGLSANVDPSDPIAVRAERLAIREAIASGAWGQTEVAEYAAGGIRLTPGEPWRQAGELESRRMPPIEAAAKTTEDAA